MKPFFSFGWIVYVRGGRRGNIRGRYIFLHFRLTHSLKHARFSVGRSCGALIHTSLLWSLPRSLLVSPLVVVDWLADDSHKIMKWSNIVYICGLFTVVEEFCNGRGMHTASMTIRSAPWNFLLIPPWFLKFMLWVVGWVWVGEVVELFSGCCVFFVFNFYVWGG